MQKTSKLTKIQNHASIKSREFRFDSAKCLYITQKKKMLKVGSLGS